VKPVLIPDYLALVGDAADGYPGIAGVGAVTAARLLNAHGGIDEFPPGVLGDQRDLALLFRDLATLRTSAPLFDDVAALRWSGPTDRFEEWTAQFDDARLLDRSRRAADLSRSRGMA
jgi:5'-3' exonuclease